MYLTRNDIRPQCTRDSLYCHVVYFIGFRDVTSVTFLLQFSSCKKMEI